MKIPMTAPVTMRIVHGEGKYYNYTMSFYIPSDLQGSPPAPAEQGVFIEERGEMVVVASRFGGFPTDITYSSKAGELYDLAMQEGITVKGEPLWTAGYDGPSVIIHRRNEVWLEIES